MAGRLLRQALGRGGWELVRSTASGSSGPVLPRDFDAEAAALCARVAPYSLTSPERIVALRDAVRYVVAAGVPGAVVECGVWRGGSMQVVAITLRELGVDDRDLYLFDTFSHMPAPGERDVDLDGRPAALDWTPAAGDRSTTTDPAYRYLPLEDVRAALLATGYPATRLRFVPGLVEETVPGSAPAPIALLRLDTDWYESTRHELRHLFPRVSPGGVVIIDDYGHYRGAREAVDEYLADQELAVYLHRIDYTGRLIVVPRPAPTGAPR